MSQHSRPANTRATQHDGTEHLAVNNTWIRRTLTRLALKTTARFYRYQGPCVAVSKHLIVKTGRSVHLTEAATINFIAANTSIPVPRIYCAFVHKNQAYIVMERIKGSSMAEALGNLSEDSREKIFTQLRRIFDELRALPPPSTHQYCVQSCVGGSLRDSRIPRSNPRFGPFKTIQDFHFWLRDSLLLEEHQDHPETEELKEIRNMVAMQDGPWPPVVFTHGDLNPFNFLVRGNQVVGIIDWEFSGWYPSYWEYTSAWCGNITRPAWHEMIKKFLDTFPEELRMENTRQMSWGDLFHPS